MKANEIKRRIQDLKSKGRFDEADDFAERLEHITLHGKRHHPERGEKRSYDNWE